MSEEKVVSQAAEEEALQEQVKVRREKLAAMQQAGKNPYEVTRFDWDTTNKEIRDNFETLEGKTVRIAGRMMSRRVMGKASFLDRPSAGICPPGRHRRGGLRRFQKVGYR